MELHLQVDCGLDHRFVADNYVKKKGRIPFTLKNLTLSIPVVFTHQYTTNVQAAMSEGTNMGKAYTDKNQAFVFRIPVYQNMPESAVTFADKGIEQLAFLDQWTDMR